MGKDRGREDAQVDLFQRLRGSIPDFPPRGAQPAGSPLPKAQASAHMFLRPFSLRRLSRVRMLPQILPTVVAGVGDAVVVKSLNAAAALGSGVDLKVPSVGQAAEVIWRGGLGPVTLAKALGPALLFFALSNIAPRHSPTNLAVCAALLCLLLLGGCTTGPAVASITTMVVLVLTDGVAAADSTRGGWRCASVER